VVLVEVKIIGGSGTLLLIIGVLLLLVTSSFKFKLKLNNLLTESILELECAKCLYGRVTDAIVALLRPKATA